MCHARLASLCMQVCLEYLERYYVLIAFTAYLFEPGFDPEARSQVSLAQWMKRRPELYRYQQHWLLLHQSQMS